MIQLYEQPRKAVILSSPASPSAATFGHQSQQPLNSKLYRTCSFEFFLFFLGSHLSV